MARRAAPQSDPRAERRAEGQVNRLLAPIAADARDVENHPPLQEAEKLRQQGIALSDDLRVRGFSWADVLSALEHWERETPRPVLDTYKRAEGGL